MKEPTIEETKSVFLRKYRAMQADTSKAGLLEVPEYNKLFAKHPKYPKVWEWESDSKHINILVIFTRGLTLEWYCPQIMRHFEELKSTKGATINDQLWQVFEAVQGKIRKEKALHRAWKPDVSFGREIWSRPAWRDLSTGTTITVELAGDTIAHVHLYIENNDSLYFKISKPQDCPDFMEYAQQEALRIVKEKLKAVVAVFDNL